MTHSADDMQDTHDSRRPQNMMSIWGRFLMMPVTALVRSVELLLRTVQEVQQVASNSLHIAAVQKEGTREESSSLQMTVSPTDSTNTDKRTTTKEDKPLNDNGNDKSNYCNPDPRGGQCLILWRYKVLFIKRDLEYAFAEAEDLIPDEISDITPWKIAEFIQKLCNRRVLVPEKWIKEAYPIDYWELDKDNVAKYRMDSEKGASDQEIDWQAITKLPPDLRPRIYLKGLPEEDKQYLRLFQEEMARYTRQDPRYEEQKIKVLKEIRDRI